MRWRSTAHAIRPVLAARGLAGASSMAWLMLAALIGSTPAWAERYELTLSARANNLYKVEGKDMYIVTEGCTAVGTAQAGGDTLSTGEGPASLSQLQFANGKTCKVRGVYGVQVLPNDRYGITVAWRARNWYEAVGTDVFMRTRLCPRVTLSERSVLVIKAENDQRLLFPDGSDCEVEATYSRLKQ